MPLITIFTPTYNRAHTLHRVYESLKNQTFKDFEWLIINDGSTDNTDEIINKFINDNVFRIRYFKQDNQHKFITTKKALDLAEGKYFTVLDSDDAIYPDSLDILIKEFEKAGKDIIQINGFTTDVNGTINGDKYPKSPLDCSIFDMRYKYKCRGEKWGLGITSIIKDNFQDIDDYIGKGFIPEGVFFFRMDNVGKHRFINKPLRIYYKDDSDEISLDNSFYSDKNAFGLAEAYKTFVNCYSDKVFAYPKTLAKNTLGYIIFSYKDGRSFSKTIGEIRPFWAKILVIFTYPFKSIIKKLI